MKRFYNHILSLLLLMVAGVTGAIAQNLQQGDLLTTVDQVVSQDIFLNSIGQYGSGFAAGTGAYTSTVSNENVFRFEATGKTSADGHPTYYLKHVASGKYFEDYVVPMDNEDSSDAPKEGWEDPTGLTADKAQAIELVVCPFQTENDKSTRDYATPGKNNENDLSFEGFVLTRAELIPREGGETSVQFLGHLGKPFYSIYNDTNVWHIYGADKVKGKDLLLNYNEYYFAGGSTLEGLYPVGTEIGTYNQTYYDAAKKVYDEFQAAINNYTLDDAAAQALVDRLVEAMEALKTKGMNGFKPGYYYIHNMSGRSLYSQEVNGVDFVYSSNTNYARPAEPTLNDVKYIWRIDADRDADNALVMTSVLSGKSISGVKAAVAGVDDGFGFTLREDGKVKVEFGTAAPAEGNTNKTFTFTSMEASVGGNGQKQFHAKFNDKAVMGWNASAAENNNFYFTPIAGLTAEKIEDMKKQALQNALNNDLANAYNTAKIAIADGYTTTSEGGTNHDATFSADDERALVKDAAQWYCNKQDSQEGSLDALTDNVLNDAAKFFHTDWHAGKFTPTLYNNHFLVATLDEPISGGVDVKFCKRLSTMHDFPTVFAIYGSNDFDANTPDEATWKLQGISSVDFTDSIEVAMENGTVRKPAVGIASCALDGAYKYIKLAAIKTNSGNGFWAVSELNLWQAESVSSTKTPRFNEIPAEVIAKLEAEATKAEAELNAGKATQAQIDALNAAYEEFQANYPDPSRVTKAYNAAKTFLDNAKTNDLIGPELAQYPESASNDLNAVLEQYKEFNGVSLKAINDAVNAINNALAAFKSSISLPAAGKYYVIRSASTKLGGGGQGFEGTQHGAVVYSKNNSTEVTDKNAASGGLFLIRMNGSDQITSEDADLSDLSDSVTISQDARLVWKAVASEGGKIEFRNVATGMYLVGKDGQMSQSAEPFALNVEGIKANTFRFNAGEVDGVTQYMNAKGAWSKVVTWKDPADPNSNWSINEVKESEIANAFLLDNRTVNQMYIGTFPVDIEYDGDIEPLNIVGVNADNKLVLTFSEAMPGEVAVPAGTPFVYNVAGIQPCVGNPDNQTVGFAQVIAHGVLAEAAYNFEVKEATGLFGTICDTKEISSHYSYLDGTVKTPAKGATYTVGVNSGYFGYVPETDEEGDAEIAISGKAETLTGINQADVVIIPSVVDVYSIDGTLVRKNVKSVNAAKNLPAGLYIIGGQKVLVK